MSSTQAYVPLQNTKVINCPRIQNKSEDMIEPTEIITCWNRNKKSLFYVFIGTIGIIAIICISLNNLSLFTTTQSQQVQMGRKALSDTSDVASQIPELRYFIVQRPCKFIPEIIAKGQIETTDNQYSTKSPYDSHWIYSIAIGLKPTVLRYGQDESSLAGKFQKGKKDCLIRINKEILNDAPIVSKMLINEERDAFEGRGYFTPQTIYYTTGDHYGNSVQPSHVSLFFGGDRQVAQEMNWSRHSAWSQQQNHHGVRQVVTTSEYTAEEREGILSLPQFNGDTQQLIQIITQRLQAKSLGSSESDVLFRNMIPEKYINGYYELEDDGQPNVINQYFLEDNWKLLTAYS